MINTFLIFSFLLLPPDLSKDYFNDLDRPLFKSISLKRPKNGPVIFIIVDALRPDRLSAYGFKRPTSPQLKKLADEGLILTQYFVNANWTKPATTTFLTGLPPNMHGVEEADDKLNAQIKMLAEMLSENHIPTGAVVGNGNAGKAFGLERGFDFYADTSKYWKGLPKAQDVIDVAMPFVKKNKETPFFLMLFFVDPHDPYHAPGKYENMFVKNKSVPLIRTPHWERIKYSKDQIERMKDTYDGAVRYTDTVLGDFFKKLKQLKIYNKATIIVTADHGEAFGEHDVFMHSHHFYEEIVRVPFIIKTPQIDKKGGYAPYLFDSTDLLPTVLSLYGIPQKKYLPGIDMITYLANPNKNDSDRAIISAFNNFGIKRRMIRTYDKKIIYSEIADEKKFMQTVGNKKLLPSVSFKKETLIFFDLLKDPFEKKDIYHKKLAFQKDWKKLLVKVKKYSQRKSLKKQEKVKELDPETYQDLRSLGYIK